MIGRSRRHSSRTRAPFPASTGRTVTSGQVAPSGLSCFVGLAFINKGPAELEQVAPLLDLGLPLLALKVDDHFFDLRNLAVRQRQDWPTHHEIIDTPLDVIDLPARQ